MLSGGGEVRGRVTMKKGRGCLPSSRFFKRSKLSFMSFTLTHDRFTCVVIAQLFVSLLLVDTTHRSHVMTRVIVLLNRLNKRLSIAATLGWGPYTKDFFRVNLTLDKILKGRCIILTTYNTRTNKCSWRQELQFAISLMASCHGKDELSIGLVVEWGTGSFLLMVSRDRDSCPVTIT